MKMRSPKIILWDLESSGIQVSTWNLYPNNGIPYQNIIKDWFIISIAWKVLGDKKISAVSVLDDGQRFKKDHTDDYYVIKKFREAIEDVDILIAYNGDKFDIKMFNSRLITHKLPPLPKIIQIDPLKEIKKIAKFTSHRLDFLTAKLLGSGKMSTPPGTWSKAMAGDRDAIKDMVAYNKVDVQILEEFYLMVRPYFKSTLNLATPGTENCPGCNSDQTQRRGTYMMQSGIINQRCQCNKCRKYFRVGKSVDKPLSKQQ